MKNILLIIVLLAFASCNNPEREAKTEKQVGFEVEYLDGYFPKNDIEFNQPVRIIIVKNSGDFDKYFGVAKTMTNNISEIDFDKNKVVAIIAKPSENKQTITISETKFKNNKLAINYKLEIGELQSFSSSDLKMFKIPKDINAVDVFSEVKEEKPTTEN